MRISVIGFDKNLEGDKAKGENMMTNNIMLYETLKSDLCSILLYYYSSMIHTIYFT